MVSIIGDDLLDALRAALARATPPTPIAGALMLHAGLRLGEVASLRWSKLWPYGAPATSIALDAADTKRHRARTIPVSEHLNREIRRAQLQAWGSNFIDPEMPVLQPNPATKPRSMRWVQRQIAAIGAEALNAHLTPHMLRHTFATRLLKVSDLETVRVALGHARVNTTQIYVHTTNDDLRSAIERLN